MNDKYSSYLLQHPFTAYSSVNSEDAQFKKHYHAYFEIYILTDGQCRYLIDEAIYNVAPGDIVLIPPYHTHKACYDTSTHSRRLLYLANTFLPPYTDEIVERKGLVYRNPRIFEEILYHFNKIEQEFLHKDDCSDYIVNGYTQIILGLILRNPNDYINDYVSGNGYITSILKYLKENYSADISLTQTAKRYSISPEYLSRIFKNEVGMTFHNYLDNIRLEEAERLLKRSNRTVSEIAIACGYNDSNYFSTKFKKAYGISPVQFRNQNK